MTVYEFFEARWTGTRSISAGGMVAFPMSGTGISNPPHRRVTASGFSNTFGMIKREDFINAATGQLEPNSTVLRHALTINLPPAILGPDTYIAPAVGGEVSGTNSTSGIPMGALFALPRNLNVDTLNVHPIVRIILRAARDYGMYVADGTGTANYNGNYAGTIEMEPNLLAQLYGGSSNDEYMSTIQSQVYSVISQYGIYRVTGASTTGPTPTSTGAVTMTSIPTTPATSTPRPTNTATVTPRPTDTGGGQSGTPTATLRPTNTPVPPTSTPIATLGTPTPTVINYYPLSPMRNLIPTNAGYTRENRIGSFRPGYEEWQCPVYRVPASESHPLVRITNTYSGRVENWPIPRYAQPAAEEDAQMCIVNLANGMVYEMFEARWTSNTTISAGGMVAFPLNSTGISNPTHYRVNAAGFANTNGMIKREDFMNANGQLDPNDTVINHALNMNIPRSILAPNVFIPPAVGGEESGQDPVNGLPVGALLALPRTVNVDTLNVHPFTRAVLRAVRDYGIYIFGSNNAPQYNGNNVGTLEVEPGVMPALYGGTSNNDYISLIQSEIYTVIAQYGLYRVSGNITGTATPVPTSNATATLVPPTATLVPPTATLVPPTSTPRPTNTPVPPTVTPRPTDTGGGQNGTPTATLPPTNTPVPPTATPPPTGALGTRIVIPTTTIRVGNTFTVSIMLDNPALAAGGGVDAAEVECTLTPENRLTGQNVTAGSAFGPNPVIVSRNFPYTDWMMFAISQSGSNPPVTVSGSIVNLTIRAARRGQATITCTVEIITANGSEIQLDPAPVTFRIRAAS
jgi:hypothetical protein